MVAVISFTAIATLASKGSGSKPTPSSVKKAPSTIKRDTSKPGVPVT